MAHNEAPTQPDNWMAQRTTEGREIVIFFHSAFYYFHSPYYAVSLTEAVVKQKSIWKIYIFPDYWAMGTNLTESKPNAQLEVYIFMEERWKVSNFAGKSSTSGTTRSVMDEHIFSIKFLVL